MRRIFIFRMLKDLFDSVRPSPAWGGRGLHLPVAWGLRKTAETFRPLGVVSRTVKRSPILRCLVMLLSIALASGNASCRAAFGCASLRALPEELRPPPRQKEISIGHDKTMGAVAGCLGCPPAALSRPELSLVRRAHARVIPTRSPRPFRRALCRKPTLQTRHLIYTDAQMRTGWRGCRPEAPAHAGTRANPLPF